MNKKESNISGKVAITISLFFSTALLFSSCNSKPSQKMMRINPALKSRVVFSGRVLTKTGKPIEWAEVTVNGVTGQTNAKGYFEIEIKRSRPHLERKGQKPGYCCCIEKERNRYVMNIRKHGFGLISKVYNCGVKDGIWGMTKATIENVDPTSNIFVRDIRQANQINCQCPLSGQVDWSMYPHLRFPAEITDELRSAIEFVENYTVCNTGISISIPANSLVDLNGNPPESKVTVALSTVDIYDPYSMPGDYSVKVNGRYRYMQTFGAGTISVTAKGRSYQPKKGTYATLTIPINPSQLKRNRKLAPSIPLLLYDENQGVWTVKGEAKLNKEGNAYIANISHFSAFNMDLIKTDQACVKIDASGIDGNFDLEVTVLMPEGDPIVKTFSVNDNVDVNDVNDVNEENEHIHVIYNLPSNSDVVLRVFSQTVPPFPIAETYIVNTGTPQEPSEPLRPDPPYSACNSQVALVEYSDVPVLEGYSLSNGDVVLQWYYHFKGIGSTQDGYKLEESTTSSTSGFDTGEPEYYYNTVNQNDRDTTVRHTLSRTSGSYWYRVRAHDEGDYTEYSNVVRVDVDVTSTGNPTVLRIVNDLYNRVDAYGTDWERMNRIVRVRIGPTLASVLNSAVFERLNPIDTTTDISQCHSIAPSYDEENSYMDFDVSTFGPAGYYVLIQTGWWESWFDPYNNYEFLYYFIHDATVFNCTGGLVYGNKWAAIRVFSPFGDPEIVKASNFLPHGSWYGTGFCD